MPQETDKKQTHYPEKPEWLLVGSRATSLLGTWVITSISHLQADQLPGMKLLERHGGKSRSELTTSTSSMFDAKARPCLNRNRYQNPLPCNTSRRDPIRNCRQLIGNQGPSVSAKQKEGG